MNLSTVINGRMHDGTCPTAGSLGECPAIWVDAVRNDQVRCGAAVYMWRAAAGIGAAQVAAWFTEAGCSDVVVYAVLHDPDNDTFEGVCPDGVRPLYVTFGLDVVTAASHGLMATACPADAPQATCRRQPGSDPFNTAPRRRKSDWPEIHHHMGAAA